MNLLVTGGAGFIGSNFILYWMKTHPNDRVVNFDALTYAGNLENLKEVETHPNYSFIHGNICKKEDVQHALQGIDTVVHFAAETHVDRSILESTPFIQTNIVGTHVLLEASLNAQVKRFHHVSTDEVFGSLALDDRDIFTEKTAYNPRSPYSASKASSDHLVRAFYYTHALPITITNCSNNYGPFQFPEKLIPLVITNILEGKKVPVYGDGLNVRDWLHVEDHCRAIDAVLSKGIIGETYCVGSAESDMNNLTIVKKILSYLKKDESYIEFVKDRPGHDRRYAISSQKIHDTLGWSPLHDFDTWLGKTIQWYSAHEEWWRHIKTGEYQAYYKKQYGGAE